MYLESVLGSQVDPCTNATTSGFSASWIDISSTSPKKSYWNTIRPRSQRLQGSRNFESMNCIEVAIRTAAELLNLPFSYTQEEYMDFLKKTSFTPQAGLEKKDVKILVDRFMTKGFKIDRDIYNEGYLAEFVPTKTRSVSWVYTMQTEETSKMGHFWTVHSELGAVLVKSEDPPRGVKAYEELYQQVDSIRKFVPRLPNSKKRKHSNNN
ncbi:unnamed protein product [Aphanomyces euteiches]